MKPSPLDFHGEIPASKSILNRLLVLQSFSTFKIHGNSQADDVVKMKAALQAFAVGGVLDCGAAGTTLRFLALRVARQPGEFRLRGSARLMARPQTEISRVLEQLGCSVEMQGEDLVVRGEGWRVPESGLFIDRSISSQFASSVFLSAWDLPAPLTVRFSEAGVSQAYLRLTLELARRAGLNFVELSEREIRVEAGSQIKRREMKAEPDLSSAFAVAALAVASRGRARFRAWPHASLQPDAIFVSVLEQMGARIKLTDELEVSANEKLCGVDVNLENSPDLFPVLAVLCALAEGESRLIGAPHLAHKESSRIEKTAEILRLMGARYEIRPDGMIIAGGAEPSESAPLHYDPDHDHRLAMAAAVARAAGFPVHIARPEVVNKSFPEFWLIAGGAS